MAEGDDAAEVADLVVNLGDPGPEVTAALVDAMQAGGKAAWVAARTLGHLALFPGSDDPRLAVAVAFGRFLAGRATDEDVALVAADTDLVEEHEDIAELGSAPRGVEVLFRMEPNERVVYGLSAAAERSRSITPMVATRIVEALTSWEEVDGMALTLLLELPRTPEVLDAIDLVARRFDGEKPLEHPRASAAFALAQAGDPRWEQQVKALLVWVIEHHDELEDTELYARTAPGVSSPLGTALAKAGVVPGEGLARVIGEVLEVLDPEGEEFTWRSMARWLTTWPDELQAPLRAVARRRDPFNPHWADDEVDLQLIRDKSRGARERIVLARYTGLLADWLAVLALSEGRYDSDVDAEFPERGHPQFIAWWQGILETSDHKGDQAAALKALVETGAMPFDEGWRRLLALIDQENLFVQEAAQVAAEWGDRIDETARAELVERLATVVTGAERDRTGCGAVLVRLGGQWPLSAEDTATMVIRDVLRHHKGADHAVALCEGLKDQAGIVERVAARLRGLLVSDERLAPSIPKDEEKQADLRRVLAALVDRDG